MIVAGIADNVLVVASEMFSRILDMQDRSSCVLFGDGAAAVVLEKSTTPGVLAIDLDADGSLGSLLQVPARIEKNALVGSGYFFMDGPAVFKGAVKKMAESSRKVCTKANVDIEQVDWLIAHQANLRIIEGIAKSLKMPNEKVVTTVTKHANTSAATIPLGLASIWDQVKSGQKILFTAAGGGFTWGSALIQI